jgi:hypothetical protein
LRLRHDLVMIGRTVVASLPGEIQARLETRLAQVSTTGVAYLRGCGAALWARRGPPPLAAVQAALDGYAEEVAALRREGATRSLSIEDVERFFSLGFAFEQMHRDLCDLDRCVTEWAQFPATPSPEAAAGQGPAPVAESRA